MAVLTLVIFVLVLIAVIVRPRGASEGISALVGAALLIAIGAIPFTDALGVVGRNWDVFLFFIGMLSVTAIAEQAGVFAWLAVRTARLSHGSKRLLFVNTFILGVVISTFLTNDATALILTPVVYSVVRLLDLDPLPYMFACTFIADTASLTLPVSNPINILFGERFGLGTGDFLRYVLVPSAAAIAINILPFLLLFRRRISGGFDPALLARETVEQVDPRFFRLVCVVLILLAMAFVAGGVLGLPAGVIAVIGAAILAAGSAILGAIDTRRFARDFSWALFPFLIGLFIVVAAVERAGLTDPVGHVLALAHGSALLSAFLATVVSALGTNLINNVPMALVLGAAIPSAHGAVGHALVFGSLLGCDLGPNLTTTGSLSTMLWLILLRQRGLQVSSLQYARLGAIVTPPMLIVAALLVGVLS